jgi:hypothetical protein
MKTILYTAITLALITITFSCENSESSVPEIENFEVGHNDTIHVGEGIHLEFDASDSEGLDFYRIDIHIEEGHEHKSAGEHIEWKMDTIITKNFNGLKNTTVHQHDIIVPENAELGAYHFHLQVVNLNGKSTSIKKELVMTEGDSSHIDHF